MHQVKMIKLLFSYFNSTNDDSLTFSAYSILLLARMGTCLDKQRVLEEINVNGVQVRRTNKLASGAYGRIWQCQDISSGENYALKETYMGN
jgi:hypothetical protein